MEDTPRQISVSRDALRAELAELKADLLQQIGDKLDTKASAAELRELTKRVDLHESGIFPPAWELRVKGMIENAIDDSTALAQEGRYRLTSVVLTMIGSTAAILGAILYAVIH